ncbi:unnamed protein product [Caenorhabditis sp. 36 PRJEB53466]|nr:unnamed protein product [Caenorhabditis sp. 36 PRJEB53466]
MPMEQPVPLYRLLSLDGRMLYADRQTLAMIGPVEMLFENAGLDYIPLDSMMPIKLELPAEVLLKVVGWCDHHKNEAEIEDDDDHISEWDLEFLSVRYSLLFDIIRAARHFEIPGLFAVCCRIVSRDPGMIIPAFLNNDDDPDPRRHQRVGLSEPARAA